jgi:hypothetical protein
MTAMAVEVWRGLEAVREYGAERVAMSFEG